VQGLHSLLKDYRSDLEKRQHSSMIGGGVVRDPSLVCSDCVALQEQAGALEERRLLGDAVKAAARFMQVATLLLRSC
jgi:hypothetical protein